jgi:hypothetical protein
VKHLQHVWLWIQNQRQRQPDLLTPAERLDRHTREPTKTETAERRPCLLFFYRGVELADGFAEVGQRRGAGD